MAVLFMWLKVIRIATEPLYFEDQNRKYLLEFDCKNCLMKIKYPS